MKTNSFFKAASAILCFITFIFIQSCVNYFKVSSSSPSIKVDSTVTANPQRYYILHNGDVAYHMNNISISSDQKSILCTLDTVASAHMLHLQNSSKTRYKKNKPEAAVLNEVHLYIQKDNTANKQMPYVLNIDKVEKMEIINKDKARTTASYVIGGVGIGVGSAAVIGIVVAALTSCPFVSSYDGSNVSIQGEIYGGAIYPQLARNDYIKMNMAPLPNGNLQLNIINELQEQQNTDLAELMVVTHDKNEQILVDETGALYAIGKKISPVTATSNNKDVLPKLLNENDGNIFSFDDTTNITGENKLHLTFNKTGDAHTAKLILRLKNSYWMDYVYQKVLEGFGDYYGTYVKQQSNKSSEELTRWTSQQLMPLQISLQTKKGLQPVQNIKTFGPLSNREIVVPIDVSNISGDKINLQLNTGFMFWEIDYAAIDFSANDNFSVSTALPLTAFDENGKDIRSLLANADGNYLVQPIPGNQATIQYAYTPLTDTTKTQTFILHAKGYYQHNNFKGAPNTGFLQQFGQPNSLSHYSMSLYQSTMHSTTNNLATNK